VQVDAAGADVQSFQAFFQQHRHMLERGRVKCLLGLFVVHGARLLSRSAWFLNQMWSSRRRAARCSLVTAARRASQRAASQISAWLRLPMTATVLPRPA